MTDRKVKECLVNMDSMTERENLQYQIYELEKEELIKEQIINDLENDV